jgi:hypothetical protein
MGMHLCKLFYVFGVIGLHLFSTLCAEERREKIFSNLYETGAWGTNEEGLGSSGPGSSMENSEPYIKFLQNFIQTNGISTIVDAGCGDWSFSKAIDWGTARYVGIDIVKPVIERCQTKFASPQVEFIHGDINEIEMPAGDLLICKDVLQYLSNSEALQFLDRISKYKYCLITNDACSNPHQTSIRSIVCGDHRPIDLSSLPFQRHGAKIFRYVAGGNEKQVFLIVNPEHEKKDEPKKKYFVINQVHPYQGFFSVFLTVINYLDLYDSGDIQGLLVDFKNHGLYYDPAYGLNSWNYYFEPINFGSLENADVDYSAAIETGRISYLAEIGLSKPRMAELVNKYIHVKPEILKEVNEFVAENFNGNYVIGIHYRGTDKSGEAARISYESVSSAVKDFANEHQITDYLVFVATDEEQFLSYMQNIFEGKVVSKDCLRSSSLNPVHYFNPNTVSPHNAGKEALMDCLLLSKCNHLIRTSSCLSLVSTYFNPDLSDHELNKRITHCYRRF